MGTPLAASRRRKTLHEQAMTIHVATLSSLWGLALGSELSPILWRFPPNFPFDATRPERLRALRPQILGLGGSRKGGRAEWTERRTAPRSNPADVAPGPLQQRRGASR
jgi:hypothetical protein